jgi:hypothetical protein
MKVYHMAAGGLVKIAKIMAAPASSRSHRPLDVAKLLRQPAANDHLHLVRASPPDPLDFFTEVVFLGEAAPAAFFLYPMWAAAAAYLKDPQYYLNRKISHCGDSNAHEPSEGPFIEWQPRHRLFPERPSYRDPNLSDADRQRLVEILQPEKRRGLEPGSVGGRPLALPSDPPRTTTSPLTWEPRSALWSAPRIATTPETERALPNVQQEDVQRRHQMGDMAPGRRIVIGDFAGSTANNNAARDFLPPTTQKASPDSQWVPVPDIRMNHGSSGSSYSQRFRAVNAPKETEPTVKRQHAKRSFTIQLDYPKPSLDIARMRSAELQKWDDVLNAVYAAWPKADGRLSTGSSSDDIVQRTIKFNNGTLELRTILRHHWQAVAELNKTREVAARIAYPASSYSQDYLLWAMQRASGVRDVQLDRVYHRPNAIVRTSLYKPDLRKPGVSEFILREIWPTLLDGLQIVNAAVQDRSGQYVHMIRVLEVYWKELKAQMTRDGKWSAHIPPDPRREQPLQLMHLQLFGRAILREGQTTHYLNLPMPVPSYATLEGIIKIADAMSQLPFVREARMFPSHHGHRKDVIVLPDGTFLLYETVLERLTHHVAMAKAERNPRVAEVNIDEGYVRMAREDIAALAKAKEAGKARRHVVIRSHTVPNEVTRRALYEWLLMGQKSTVVRRRASGAVVPVFHHSHHDAGAEGIFNSEGWSGRGVGLVRDAYGILVSHLAWANVARSALLARMSDGRPPMTPAIPPPPPGPAPVRDGDVLAAEANDLAVRLSVLRRYSTHARTRWDDLAWTLENEEGSLVEKLPRIRAFVDGEEKRIGDARLRQAPPEWAPDPVVVPPYLYDRLMAAYGNPEQHVTIGDLSRAYNYYFSEMGELPPGKRHRTQLRSTQEIVYGDTVHRQLTLLAPLSAAEQQARLRVADLARAAKMHDFGGHWWAMGAKVARRDRVTISSTIRLYLPIHSEHASDIMAALIALVGPEVRAGRDVQFKMAQDPREWRGDDGALVYSGRQDYYRMMQSLRALEDQHPGWFRRPLGTPLVARLIKADGTPSNISIAQSSPKASESVNGPIAEYATRAMQWYRLRRARGLQPDVTTMIQFTARQLQKNGRDLAHPAYLSQDQDTGMPGWATYLDVHVHTDQFFPDDVPTALELATHELQTAATPAAAAAAREVIATIHRRYPKGGR